MSWLRGLVLVLGIGLLLGARAAQAQTAAPTDALFQVPDGAPEQLLQYIEKLDQSEPQSGTLEEVTAYRRKAYRAAIQAADKVLAGKPTAAQSEAAWEYKVGSLMMLLQMGEAGVREEIAALVAELDRDGKAEAARRLRGGLLQLDVQRSLLAEPAVFLKLVAEVQAFILEKPATGDDVALAILVSDILHRRGLSAEGAAFSKAVGEHMAGSDQPPIAAIGTKIQNVGRRMGLVGHPLRLEGTDVAGKPIRWDDYRGKVVQIIFWATWCPVCKAELENIAQAYARWHAKGFEVVGISVDENRGQLEEFLAQKQYPWTTLASADPKAQGLDHPLATYYGVTSFPTLILVGQEGKVVGLDVRGPELAAQLEKLLGPAEPAPPAKP